MGNQAGIKLTVTLEKRRLNRSSDKPHSAPLGSIANTQFYRGISVTKRLRADMGARLLGYDVKGVVFETDALQCNASQG